jgi:HlyD family secretion protein
MSILSIIKIKHYKTFILSFVIIMLTLSCKKKDIEYDAAGTFEAEEIIVSAETNGKILKFTAEEGDQIKVDQEVVKIDDSNLNLQKDQAVASVQALNQKQNSAQPQVAVFKEQLKVADAQISTLQEQMKVIKKEQSRIQTMYKSEAATAQQMDDINGKVDVLHKQIISAENQKMVILSQMKSATDQIAIQNRGILSEQAPMEKRVALIEDQLKKSSVLSPTNGTILTKYAEQGEFVAMGKPLFKLADLTNMTLRAYITGDQLSSIKIGDHVAVYIDDANGKNKTYQGTVKWISDKAEFTPKTIQTKDERANLVYAVKLSVKNDGTIKIGMYGEIALNDGNIDK